MVELGYMTKAETKRFVAKLRKSMYGNVDAALLWYRTLMRFLCDEPPEGLRMTQLLTDPCVVYQRTDNKTDLIVGITVDNSFVREYMMTVTGIRTTTSERGINKRHPCDKTKTSVTYAPVSYTHLTLPTIA